MSEQAQGSNFAALPRSGQAAPERADSTELVLHAITELMRCQREILETVQRLEVSLDELHDRLEARAPGPVDPSAPADEVDDVSPAALAPGEHAHRAAPREEELLRAIQRTVSGGEPEAGERGRERARPARQPAPETCHRTR